MTRLQIMKSRQCGKTWLMNGMAKLQVESQKPVIFGVDMASEKDQSIHFTYNPAAKEIKRILEVKR